MLLLLEGILFNLDNMGYLSWCLNLMGIGNLVFFSIERWQKVQNYLCSSETQKRSIRIE